MGRLVNFVLGLIIIVIGVDYWFNFISGIIPLAYSEFIGPLVLIVIGILLIRSSKVPVSSSITGALMRIWSIAIIGVVTFLLGGIILLDRLGYLPLPVANWMLAIGIVALGLILIFVVNKPREFSLAHYKAR